MSNNPVNYQYSIIDINNINNIINNLSKNEKYDFINEQIQICKNNLQINNQNLINKQQILNNNNSNSEYKYDYEIDKKYSENVFQNNISPIMLLLSSNQYFDQQYTIESYYDIVIKNNIITLEKILHQAKSC